MSRNLLDPDLAALEDPALSISADCANLSDIRDRLLTTLATILPPAATAPEVVMAPRLYDDEPSVPIRIHRPAGLPSPAPAILHIHGGGFIMGTAGMNDGSDERLATRHRAIVASVDYRLAPETPFPGPLEDCYAAVAWLAANADAIGIDPDRISLLGESAGGGLAAALAILARDRGGPKLASQFLIYPMLDDRTGTPDGAQNPTSGQFGWTRASNRFGWRALRGGQPIQAERAGHFAPAKVRDMTGLPFTYIAVGALDLFVDESLDYGVRLLHAGVRVELHLYPGASHGFDLVTDADVSIRFRRDLDDALSRSLRLSPNQ
ncbi:arylesterase [Sphingobium sp. SCG-1]|uniref:alpha/beta hydrolase n=1 Tax=Sphingobium sp. SCG-1 TaxID=2072936 RepID=UPI000CD69750|nr:alpha/beta hydrolase [Sphingobium sp. SCG-1]AUW59675.1 arylesterase [Sphingobium sp. SCG-1]